MKKGTTEVGHVSNTKQMLDLALCTAVDLQEGETEKAETRHRVEEDRKPQIEASIVRIMKARKVSGAAAEVGLLMRV